MIYSQKLCTEELPFIVSWFKQSNELIKEEGLLDIEINLNKITVWMSLYESLEGDWLVWYDDMKLVGFSFHVQKAPSNNRPWIGMVLVDPEKRDCGYGIRIVNGLSNTLLKQGASIVYSAVPI